MDQLRSRKLFIKKEQRTENNDQLFVCTKTRIRCFASQRNNASIYLHLYCYQNIHLLLNAKNYSAIKQFENIRKLYKTKRNKLNYKLKLSKERNNFFYAAFHNNVSFSNQMNIFNPILLLKLICKK